WMLARCRCLRRRTQSAPHLRVDDHDRGRLLGLAEWRPARARPRPPGCSPLLHARRAAEVGCWTLPDPLRPSRPSRHRRGLPELSADHCPGHSILLSSNGCCRRTRCPASDQAGVAPCPSGGWPRWHCGPGSSGATLDAGWCDPSRLGAVGERCGVGCGQSSRDCSRHPCRSLEEHLGEVASRRSVDHCRDTAEREAVNCLLGLGTYRCRDVRKAAGIAAAAGCPLIDTAPVYGNGAAQQQLAPVLAVYPKLRVSTKIGHMTVQQARRAVRAGAIRQEEVHNGHSIHPDYVDFQLRENIAELGRPAIDLVYLHNPERFGDTDPELLHTALRSAFERLEKACADGVIDGYGVATWSGFKDGAFTVPRLAKLAQEAAGSPE